MKRKINYTVDDIMQLLQSQGAGRDPKSPIRIWDYEQLIPSRKYLNGLKKIGQGGYGSVYQINIEGLDYAFKIMIQKKGETLEQLQNNFYNECKSLLSINHNRVLRLIGVAIDTSDENDACFCHYTNYQQKGNVYDLIKNKKLFPDSPPGSPQRFYKKIRLLAQIAEGIHAIHQVGLIHRDLKAQNVFLDENDAPKVADLGLEGENTQMSTSKARETAQWMAPEVFEYRVSPASDIWALACIAIEIFNETLPYPQLKDMAQIRDYICNQKRFPDFSKEIAQDQNLAQLLLYSFKFNQQERPNIQQFRQAVDQIKQNHESNSNIQNSQSDFGIQQNLSNESKELSQVSKTQKSNTKEMLFFQHSQQQQNINQLVFLIDAQTYLYKKGIQFAEKQIKNSQILMDQGSSVYYTKQYIYVSGGLSRNCQKNFQQINRNSFLVEKSCEMMNPRNGHGMLQLTTQDNTYILIISGNQNDQKDTKYCEIFDLKAGKCQLFQSLIFSGKNQGLVIHKQGFIVLGGESTEFTQICQGQWYDLDLQIWRIMPKCLPIGSSVSLVRGEEETIYMFGEFLKGVYTFKFDEDDPKFELISDHSYPGKACNQNPIINQNIIYIFDKLNIHSFDISTKKWQTQYLFDEYQNQNQKEQSQNNLQTNVKIAQILELLDKNGAKKDKNALIRL